MSTEAGAQESKEDRRFTRFMCLKGGPALTEEVAMTGGMVRTGGSPYGEGCN